MSSKANSDSPELDSVAYYNQNAQSFFNNTAGLDISTLYEKFEQHLTKPAHILDAGCGSGRDSLYFINQGYQVTAFDASEAMVKIAAEYTGQPVLHLTFQDIGYVDTFDGIWACASLLHVDRAQIDSVLTRLSNSLKTGGAFYVSFKYGDDEVIRQGRLFNNYTEQSFRELIAKHPELYISDIWITEDLRPNRASEKWLNAVLVKQPLAHPLRTTT